MTKLEPRIDAPLTEWEDGSVRITGSRVPIDSLVYHFKLGATAEEIVYKFPSLLLAQVYGAIYYYLTHRQEIEQYLEKREAAAEETRKMIESSPLYCDKGGIRERLLARAADRGLLDTTVKHK